MLLENGLIPATDVAYEIDNSLRFNDDDSAYLSRTPASAGNRKTWTWSGWVKLGNLDIHRYIITGGTNSDNMSRVYITNTNQLAYRHVDSNTVTDDVRTSAVFRDPSAWYHVLVLVDTTQGVASNRVKLYVNGQQETSLDVSNYPSSSVDTDINSTTTHYLATQPTISSFLDGYLAEVNFIDGQALTPDNFGETGDYGEWKPIKYTGTYGTNGFYLDFENSGSLGADTSGNGNNWTPNNLTANDQMLDSPTNNFATLNPLNAVIYDANLREGNLEVFYTSGTASQGSSTLGVNDGKWYCEFGVEAIGSNPSGIQIGIIPENGLDWSGTEYNYKGDGDKYSNGSTSYGATYTTGDVIGVAYNGDAGTIGFYKNGVYQGVAFSSISLTTTFFFNVYTSSASSNIVANFGQDSSFAGNKTTGSASASDGNGIGDFYYTPPTGYLALCTQNLPEPTVVPSEHFNTVLYSGNGGTQSITGVGFQPDWIWAKPRNTTHGHSVFDAVRGGTLRLDSSSTQEERSNEGQIAFTSDGFNVTTTYPTINNNTSPLVAWNWKMAGTGVSNTDGTITSTVSANTAAGQSIVSYTGNGGTNVSVGHGLSEAPQVVIIKDRDTSNNWYFNHTLVDGTNDGMYLNLTDANGTFSGSVPTSSVFYVDGGRNASGNAQIAYCFHSVDGYSKVGSYTGNGSTDGTFVFTGGRPAYIMIKRTDSTGDWNIYDNERLGYNASQASKFVNANSSGTEGSRDFDFLSNGFKPREATSTINASGATYIFLAFAENPFKYTNAR